VDPLIIVPLVIVVALFFDFTNGFHDTANAMATPIATGAMKPKTAVAVAAVMNLLGAFLSTEVSLTISKGIVNDDLFIQGDSNIDPVTTVPAIIFAALTGAIIWNLTTWLFGLPSSSSHALFGGLIGAVVVSFGITAIHFDKVAEKVLIPALFAPLIAAAAAALATLTSYLITGRSAEARNRNGIATGRAKFKVGQIFSSSLLALSHGTNDAQKTMGIITLALVAGGFATQDDPVQFWVILSAAIAIALGTYMGGWRIIKTMGHGLSEIRPAQGFAAEISSGATILSSSFLGFALSTTQVASGSVIGSALGRKGAQVRWNKAGQIVLAWLVTLPASAVVGGISAALVRYLGVVGFIIDSIILVAGIYGIFRVSARNKINHKNVAPSEVAVVAETAIRSPRQVRQEAARAAKAAAKAAKAAKSSKGKGKK
jgi:PiT family inorganic phosphate transporter